MEFNVVKNSHILLGNESSSGIYHEENLHTQHHHHQHLNLEGENIWHVERRSSTPIHDDNYFVNDHENFMTENNFGDHNGEYIANDIEIIAIDPNQEYSSDEEMDDGEESVFEDDHKSENSESSSFITIEKVKAALQASGHSRVSRQSLSLPHSPTRYSMDFSGISFDDLDIHNHFADLPTHNVRPLPIVDSVDSIKTFDLASYITQDDNFEVISPAKVLPYNTSSSKIAEDSFVISNHSLPISMHNNSNEGTTIQEKVTDENTNITSNNRKRRNCVLSSKRIHYQSPSDEEMDQMNKSSNECELNFDDVEIEEKPDNTKGDPTWMPFKNKEIKISKTNSTSKSSKVKEPKIKKIKSVPIKPSNTTSNSTKQNLLKVCKTTSRTRILNVGSQLTKDKIHKITKSPVGKTINLDHDYCTAKQKSNPVFKQISQRKAIEIPIIDATLDKKLSRLNSLNNKKEDNQSKSTKIKKHQSNLTEPSKTPITTNAQVSLLKSNQVKVQDDVNKSCSEVNPSTVRRKLNLAEYMQRRENQIGMNEVENPILAAKRKVLRKQELKKEAKMKGMEPKIENVPFLPILPLAEITGMGKNENVNTEPIRVLINPDYEEIVIVSMATNTEISIPPAADDEKSLLAYVNDTIKKVKDQTDNKGNVQFSNSLISSIQDVVLKKGNASLPTDIASPDCALTPTHGMSPGKPETAKSKNCSPSHQENADEDNLNDKEKEHGEDKTIMHLRKDRARPETKTISVQTLDVPSFVPLRRLSPSPNARQSQVAHHRSRRSRSRDNRRTRSRSQHYRRSSSSHRSSRNQCSNRSKSRTSEKFVQNTFRRSRSRKRTMSGNSESSSYSTASSSSSSSSSGSSSSCEHSFKHEKTSKSHTYYNSASSRRSSSSFSSRSRSRESIRYRPLSRGHNRQHEDPEKRNIVYVGQLEHDLTKEALKKKFTPYGLVSNVSIHLKENGMRYGFVTFSKPEEAYRAIDSSSKDSNLNKYDISFGGRRAFCGSHYADLDGINSYINYHQISYPIEPYESTVKKHEETESFEEMLNKLKASINAKKPTTS